jgi:hypothetical protein
MVTALRPIEVRTAAADEGPKVAAMLADAFINDPVFTFLRPGLLRQRARLRTMFVVEMEQYVLANGGPCGRRPGTTARWPSCHPERGTKLDRYQYTREFQDALAATGITDYVRPFRDVRHASLTNGAAAGENPIALMTRAGHASMDTTKLYVHLAGTVFRDEAEALERRLLGTTR